MTEPIAGCREDVRRCSAEDRTIAEAASADNVVRAGKPLPGHVTPNGPARRELKQSRATASAELLDLTRRIGHELHCKPLTDNAATRLVERLVGKFGGIAGRVYGGVAKVTMAHRVIVEQARETAALLDEAARRDGMVLFVLDVVGARLDRGYVAVQRSERAGSSVIAKGIADRLTRLPAPKFAALLEGLERSAREGLEAARTAGLRSRDDFALALRKDPELRQRYDAETAFRLAVDSVVFASGQNEKR